MVWYAPAKKYGNKCNENKRKTRQLYSQIIKVYKTAATRRSKVGYCNLFIYSTDRRTKVCTLKKVEVKRTMLGLFEAGTEHPKDCCFMRSLSFLLKGSLFHTNGVTNFHTRTFIMQNYVSYDAAFAFVSYTYHPLNLSQSDCGNGLRIWIKLTENMQDF